jgi:hypothetical protein
MIRALISGLAGATALTVAHEVLRKQIPDAPRMDVLGMEVMQKALNAFGINTAQANGNLFKSALAGDIISNTLYYSGVGGRRGMGAWIRGGMLGLSAGLGIIGLSPKLGFSKSSSCKNMSTCAATVGLYVLGGLAAAAVANIIGSKK